MFKTLTLSTAIFLSCITLGYTNVNPTQIEDKVECTSKEFTNDEVRAFWRNKLPDATINLFEGEDYLKIMAAGQALFNMKPIPATELWVIKSKSAEEGMTAVVAFTEDCFVAQGTLPDNVITKIINTALGIKVNGEEEKLP
jgi:hypothetical protein